MAIELSNVLISRETITPDLMSALNVAKKVEYETDALTAYMKERDLDKPTTGSNGDTFEGMGQVMLENYEMSGYDAARMRQIGTKHSLKSNDVKLSGVLTYNDKVTERLSAGMSGMLVFGTARHEHKFPVNDRILVTKNDDGTQNIRYEGGLNDVVDMKVIDAQKNEFYINKMRVG